MSLFRPRKPSRPGARLAIWEMLFNGKFPFVSDSKGRWAWGATGYRYIPNFPTGSSSPGGGIRWQVPKELDTRALVPANTLVYISPGNTLVTVGLVDLVSATTMKALAGTWLAVKNVPAATGAGYNVPQLPIPGSNIVTPAVPSGTPLKGDADGSNVFWMPVELFNLCANNS